MAACDEAIRRETLTATLANTSERQAFDSWVERNVIRNCGAALRIVKH